MPGHKHDLTDGTMNQSPTPSTVRAFLAILLPPPILQGLENLVVTLKARLPGNAVRWNRPPQIHLTLQFLGNIPSDSISALMATLTQACASFSPMSLTAQGLGTFPHPHRPRVLWAGLHGAVDDLLRLQQAIEQTCPPWNSRQNQPFKPHLTLARFNRPDRATARQLESLLQDLGSRFIGTWVAEEVALMRSELTPQGAVHSPLGTCKLGL